QMTAHEAIKRSNKRARTGVISTGGWAVYDVADVPILWAFAALWTRYLNTVPDAGPAQAPSSLLFFEFSGSCVNAVQLHVYDADVLVRRGVHGTASDNRRSGRRSDRFAWPRSWRRTG